jgi:hypothetical protein
MVIQNHQSVGNSDRVFAAARGKAYDLVLETLERHPAIQLLLSYSGSRPDCLVAGRPGHLQRLANLVAREQIEFLGGGYCEALKPLILRETKRE